MIFPTLHLNIERWKFNKDYGIYVSNMGHFKDRYKRLMPIKINEKGYCTIQTETNSSALAHRLVMFTWCPIPDAENLTVDHLDHNKRYNAVKNLEWVTKEENQKRALRDLISPDTQKLSLKKEQKLSLKKERRKLDRISKARKEFCKLSFNGNLFSITHNENTQIFSTPEQMFEYLIDIVPSLGVEDAISKASHLQDMIDGTNYLGKKYWGHKSNRRVVKIIKEM